MPRPFLCLKSMFVMHRAVKPYRLFASTLAFLALTSLISLAKILF